MDEVKQVSNEGGRSSAAFHEPALAGREANASLRAAMIFSLSMSWD